MSEIVILENKQGSKLFKDRFIHGGQTYLVADMKQASLSSGFLKPTVLAINFKDGTQKHFRVGIVSTSSSLNTSAQGFLIDTASQDLKASTQQWVTIINMIITTTTTT